MPGSIFSRVVVGASPFIATTLDCLAFVVVHRLPGWISIRNDSIGPIVKGEKESLYANGVPNKANMRRAGVSEKDLLESVRLLINTDSFDEVKEIIIERNGEMSVIRK